MDELELKGLDVPTFANLCFEQLEEFESKATVVTPGGRVGNDRRLGSRTNGTNWVERSKPGNTGDLPEYIRIVRNGLMKHGHSEGQATALAVAAIKRWAEGRNNVSPKVRAAAQAALAEWEKMKATAHKPHKDGEPEYWETKDIDSEQLDSLGKRGMAFRNHSGEWSYPIQNRSDLENAIQAFGRAADEDKPRLKRYIKKRARALKATDAIPDTWSSNAEKSYSNPGDGSIISHDPSGTEEKAESMNVQHKTVGVSGLKVDSPDEGIITAFVSITGIVDNVKDIIEPGAYAKTLATRTPKGVWSHEWSSPVSKTVDIKELMPGDPGLPDTLPNGDPWPQEAGALRVKMQFNLNTERGRTAYEDVKFFGPEQEWSIGYNVPVGGATKDMKNGIRRIQTLDLYEFSPVLFGAMPSARTAMGVKAAQLANMQYKSLFGDDYYVRLNVEELDNLVAEAKELISDGIETKSIMATEREAPEDYASDDDPLPFGEKGLLTADNIHLLEKASEVINDLLTAVYSGAESKAEKFGKKTLEDSVNDLYDTELDEKTIEEISDVVSAFNIAVEAKSAEDVEDKANDLLDIVDDNIDDVDEKTAEVLSSLAQTLHDVLVESEEKAARGKRKKPRPSSDPDNDGDDDSNDPNDLLDDGEEDPEDLLDGGADEAVEDGNGTVKKPKRDRKKPSEKGAIFDTTEVKSLEDFLNGLP